MAARKPSPKQQPKLPKSKAGFPKLDDDSELSPAQARELEKRVQDLDDRTRFMLVSTLGPNFVLYYNISDDTYGWNDPAHATLFKRRKAAEVIQQLLDDKDSIVQCAVDKNGQLVKKSLATTLATGAKKSGAKKSGTKKSGTKKSGTKKSGTKKSGTKKSGTKKSGTKKSGTKKSGTR